MKRLSNLLLMVMFSFLVSKAQPGSMDRSFFKDFDFQERDIINSVAIQSDGKILLGGAFWYILDNNYSLNNIVRLNQNGSLDTNYKINNHYDYEVSNFMVQKDSKILISGRNINVSFSTFNKISRLNPDDTWDLGFNPRFNSQKVNFIKPHIENKLLVGYSESCFQDELIRMVYNGKVDKSFRKAIFNGSISSISVLENGKILVSGFFTEFEGEYCPSFIRLNSDGSLDTTFNVIKYWDQLFPSIIVPISNGKLLVTGYFSPNLNRIPVIRLNENGSLDSTFKIEPIFDKQCEIKAIHLQTDGKIIFGGRFLTDNWERNIVRLNSNGSLDKTFKTGEGFNFPVRFILPLSQNKIIVAGDFNQFNGMLADRIACLNIKEESSLNVLILPNPSIGVFKIVATQPINLIIVRDALGNEVLRTEPKNFDSELDLTEKPRGFYYVTAYSNEGSKFQKILKN